MYVFSDALRETWSTLFAAMKPALASAFGLDGQLRFDCDVATLNHPDLLIGQTCGYPLVKFLPRYTTALMRTGIRRVRMPGHPIQQRYHRAKTQWCLLRWKIVRARWSSLTVPTPTAA